MGQGYSQIAPLGPGPVELPELSDLTFEKPLGGARFLKTIRARHASGVVVVKICQKLSPTVSFKQYVNAVKEECRAIQDIPNVLVYRRIRETNTYGLLVRQYIHSSLYDRISIRPFLENIEKKWIAFQLLSAVRDCHSQGVFHGDIKSENVVITSWGWVFLTDFASAFKPVYLPEDNPAEFSFFYDTSARRTCYLAPERFLAAGEKPGEDNVVQWNMDIFSLGCVLAELFTESPTFTLTQLFRYRKGEYDPTLALLEKVDDVHVRALITSMIRADPSERWHAQDYLDEYKSKAFPLYFYQHLHALMQDITDPFAGRNMQPSSSKNNGGADDRIERMYRDYEMLSVSLGYPPSTVPENPTSNSRDPTRLYPLEIDLPQNRHAAHPTVFTGNEDNGTLILLNVVTSSIRSTARASSKVKACELFLAYGERLSDEAKLDRILPYVMLLLEDPAEIVLIAALRTMTQLLSLVRVASPVNSFLFTQYIFPRLQTFVGSKGFKSNPTVRATYAASLASLAESASRFLEIMQALRADGSLHPSTHSTDEDAEQNVVGFEAYDTTRLELVEHFEGQTKVFLTDNDTSVKRAFLQSVPSLCVFFGESRAADVVLTHLNTYLNDPDWQLKRDFFKTIVGVAVCIGGTSLEELILPLIVQALTDPQEFVVEQALRSLASMAELGLLQRPKTWELIDAVARFSVHPNMWIKEAAIHFVSAATTYLSVADIRILVTPLIQPYLKVPVSCCSEDELLDALKKPLPRAVLDLALSWAQKSDRGLFWRSAKESRQLSYRGGNNTLPLSSMTEIGPRSLGRLPKTDDDEQWLGRLRNAGMRGDDEIKLLALREYLWRAAQRQKRDDPTSPRLSMYEEIIKLSGIGITAQTVIFDHNVDVYDEHMRMQNERTIAEALEDAVTPMADEPFKPLQLEGVSNDRRDDGVPQSSKPLEFQPSQLTNLRTHGSGNLSSSPGSGLGLLARDGEITLRHRTSAMGLMAGADLRKKATAEVATDEATAAGRVGSHHGSTHTSPAPTSRRTVQLSRRGHKEKAHNYEGNDPTVLRLLDAIYLDTFPLATAEFGSLVQPLKRGPIPSSNAFSAPGLWRPQGQLVAVLAEHTDRVTRIVVAPDHSFFLTGSDDGTVKVWNATRLERNVTHRARQTHRLSSEAKVTSLCFVEATHSFVCTGSDGSLQVVKVDTSLTDNGVKYGKLRVLRDWTIPNLEPRGEHCVWVEHYRAESASTLILVTNLGRIMSIDLRYMTINFELHNPAQHGTPTCFCIGRRRDWLLLGTSQGVLDLWDLRFCLRLRSWTFHYPTPITRLQVHPSRKTARRNRVCIAGGSAAGDMSVWDIEKTICHEVYRAASKTKDRIQPRQYELKVLEDDRSDGLVQNGIEDLGIRVDSSGTAASTWMQFGLQQSPTDSETLHGFVVSGGPDDKVRFWDCERIDGCRIVASPLPVEKHTYAYTQLSMDTRVLSETVVEEEKAPIAANKPTSSKKSASSAAPVKPTRFDTIRESARSLLKGHLDTITDVALLERPFGMVISADRSGMVFVHQ